MKILVVGGTGNQGSAVVRHSLKAGHEVHALVRNPGTPAAVALADLGVTLRVGDMDQTAGLGPAFAGIEGVFSVQNFWTAGHVGEVFQGRAVVEAAQRAGVKAFVQTSAGFETGLGIPNIEVKAIIEAMVREAFPDVFIIRPVWFIESLNLTSFNQATGNFEFVTDPDQPHAWVALDDVGRIVADAFSQWGPYAGVTMNLASQVNTAREMTEAFNRAFGTHLGYHRFTEAELAAKIRQWATLPVFRRELEAIFGTIQRENFTVDWPLHERLLPGRYTLDQWATEVGAPLWTPTLKAWEKDRP